MIMVPYQDPGVDLYRVSVRHSPKQFEKVSVVALVWKYRSLLDATRHDMIPTITDIYSQGSGHSPRLSALRQNRNNHL